MSSLSRRFVLSLAFMLVSAQIDLLNATCTELSLQHASWDISDWWTDIEEPYNGGSVIFRLHNNANNYTTMCFRRGVVGQCFWVAGEDNDLTGTTFEFDEKSNKLEINQTWTCPGADTAHLSVFNGVASATVLSNCTFADEELTKTTICGEKGGTLFASVTAEVSIVPV
ncbi:hypothetical protein B0H63DRAFT_559903 [Podospora didyma]|uniref:AA1-like domain-containing protein n=1 Tax=Podospora didyma TaxID=330526 RepID=A0AAE0NPD3_9PEZI|nr:hypothetical protein B0H63DRAFT_559903 [Podospora didyma]